MGLIIPWLSGAKFIKSAFVQSAMRCRPAAGPLSTRVARTWLLNELFVAKYSVPPQLGAKPYPAPPLQQPPPEQGQAKP